jgi:hypothetical protein
MPEIDPIIIAIAHYAVALLFLSSAYAKATNFAVFRATLAEYELLPPALAGLAAVVFTGAECLIGSTALFAGTATAAMIAAACLLCLYALAIGINLARGRRDIDCGCTGPATRQQLSGWLLARNAGLVAFAAAGGSLALADWIVVGLGLAAVVTLYAAINQLMANVPRLDALDAVMDSA